MALLRSNYWTLDAGDWSFVENGGGAVIVSPDESGSVRIATTESPRWIGRDELAAFAHVPSNTPTREVEFGQFGGISCEGFDVDGSFWRLWVLNMAELILIVEYRREDGKVGSDGAVVDHMLSTLRDNRP